MSSVRRNGRRRGAGAQQNFSRKPIPADFKKADSFDMSSLSTALELSSFEDMGLDKHLLKGIYAHGFEKPALCQQSVILPIINGSDVIMQAESGLGKTGAFCIGVLQRVIKGISEGVREKNRVLVISPTQELAFQTYDEMKALKKNTKVRVDKCIGGVRISQRPRFEEADVIIGTLGKLWHVIFERKLLHLDTVKILVIDEFDKMITERSSYSQLSKIISNIPGEAQVILVSATAPQFALKRSEQIVRNPFTFLRKNEQLQLKGIRQFHFRSSEKLDEKVADLIDIIKILDGIKGRGIIFCNMKTEVFSLDRALRKKWPEFEAMSDVMVGTQDDRMGILDGLKSGRIRMLLASDLIGRGVDIQHLKWVINFNMPDTNEEYIHRIGRAGRYGRKGIAISFVSEFEMGKIESLEKFYSCVIPALRESDFKEMKKNLN